MPTPAPRTTATRETSGRERKRTLRRVVSAAMFVGGAALLWLAPSTAPGLIAFALGVVLELLGLVLDRPRPPR